MAITEGPAEGSSQYNLSSVTYRFTVTGNPSTTQCRVYLNGSAVPGYSSCSASFTSQIYTTSPNYWVFQLRVTDTFGNAWTITRTFYNYYFG